jgi:hypothetical protein
MNVCLTLSIRTNVQRITHWSFDTQHSYLQQQLSNSLNPGPCDHSLETAAVSQLEMPSMATLWTTGITLTGPQSSIGFCINLCTSMPAQMFAMETQRLFLRSICIAK